MDISELAQKIIDDYGFYTRKRTLILGGVGAITIGFAGYRNFYWLPVLCFILVILSFYRRYYRLKAIERGLIFQGINARKSKKSWMRSIVGKDDSGIPYKTVVDTNDILWRTVTFPDIISVFELTDKDSELEEGHIAFLPGIYGSVYIQPSLMKRIILLNVKVSDISNQQEQRFSSK